MATGKSKSVTVKEGSFKEKSQEILLNKPITLFWGYNGSGKTTISRAIAKQENTLVYNTDFVRKHFLEDNLAGIFTLGDDKIKTREDIKTLEEKRNNTKRGIGKGNRKLHKN